MDATLIKLLGAVLPNTLAGTIIVKLTAIAVPTDVLTLSLKNFLRLIDDPFLFFIITCLMQLIGLFYFLR